jgi:thiamine pyrophosphokinase
MASYPEIPDEFALVLLGGEIGEDAVVERLFASASLIVCADSGAEHALKLGCNVQAIVGDLDSVSNDTLEYYRSRGSEILQISEQESNDFEKALRYLNKRYTGNVKVIGIGGNRTDHMLTNFSVMLRYTDRFRSLMAYDGSAEHRFLTPERNSCEIICAPGTIISLTPFGEADGIHTEHLEYPLSSEDLRLGVREGLSNSVIRSPAVISIERGALLVSVLV